MPVGVEKVAVAERVAEVWGILRGRLLPESVLRWWRVAAVLVFERGSGPVV
jgi:hypothetical protein